MQGILPGTLTPLNTTRCNAADVNLVLTNVTQSPLPPFALYEPGNGQDCTLGGIFSPRWNLDHLRLTTNHTPGTNYSTVRVEGDIGYHQQPFGVDVPILPGTTNATDGSVWHDCLRAQDNRPCRFKIDTVSNLFTFNQLWSCADIDPKNPLALLLPLLSNTGGGDTS